MARTGAPRKPKIEYFLLLRGEQSAERQQEWSRRMKQLAKVLLQAAEGRAAEILAQQAKVSTEDVVQLFLGPRSDDLYWSLRLAGNWELLAGDKRPSIGEVREKLDDLANAYEELALTMCDRAVGYCNDTDDERAGVREEFRLLGFSESEADSFLSEPGESSDRLNRAASDIRGWMYAYPANGRGSLASIIVAEVFAAFFDKARLAAKERNDAETAKLLRVKFARTNDGKGPANSFCRAVESALLALVVRGAPSKICPQGAIGSGWRSAVQELCKFRNASKNQLNDPAVK